MSIIARFSIPAEEFVLGEILEAQKGVRIRLESLIPTGESVIPYLWVPREDAVAIRETLTNAARIEGVRVVDETDTETLFRVDWGEEVDGLIDIFEETEAVLLEADGHGDVWSFRVRFPEHEGLSVFYRTCVERGLSPELDEVNNPLGTSSGTEFGITEAQRDALMLALETGYFDVPRQITLEDLAENFDISDTAFSQRLRRGLSTLLSSTLLQQSTRSPGPSPIEEQLED